MDLQKVLPQMILLLLFLNLSPLGGHSHPLGSPSQSPEQSTMQKLLELIREKSEEMAQRQLSKDQGPTKELLKRVLRSQDSAFRIQERLRNSKMAHSSSCFGQKIDRIGAVSRLGCDDILAQPASTLPTVFKTKAVCQEVSHGYFITPSQG